MSPGGCSRRRRPGKSVPSPRSARPPSRPTGATGIARPAGSKHCLTIPPCLSFPPLYIPVYLTRFCSPKPPAARPARRHAHRQAQYACRLIRRAQPCSRREQDQPYFAPGYLQSLIQSFDSGKKTVPLKYRTILPRPL